MSWRRARGRPASTAGADHPAPPAGLRELLERQRVELEGHVAEAERRLGEGEGRTAQAEQRAESAEQRAAQAERKIEQAETRAADAERTIEQAESRAADAERKLEQAESRAADAERKLSSSKLKPRAARRLAEARGEAEKARAEAKDLARERAALKGRVTELTAQMYKLQLAREGEQSEHEARETDLQQRLAESGAEHGREHTMRLELEQRLATEVAERQRIGGVLEALEQSYTGPAVAGEQEPSELQRARSADDGFAARSATAPGAAKAEAGALPEAGTLSAGDRTSDGPFPEERRANKNEMRGRRLPFLRRRSSLPCGVCRRPRPAMSDAEATASGWELAGAGALCPTCRREGWRFPPGASVPFRAAGARSSN
jgi:hypothetical protein